MTGNTILRRGYAGCSRVLMLAPWFRDQTIAPFANHWYSPFPYGNASCTGQPKPPSAPWLSFHRRRDWDPAAIIGFYKLTVSHT